MAMGDMTKVLDFGPDVQDYVHWDVIGAAPAGLVVDMWKVGHSNQQFPVVAIMKDPATGRSYLAVAPKGTLIPVKYFLDGEWRVSTKVNTDSLRVSVSQVEL